MKIYTKKGDQGETSLLGGQRVFKNHHRIEAYGTVDELNAFTAHLRDQLKDEAKQKSLHLIQINLFSIGSLLAVATGKRIPEIKGIKSEDIKYLEEEMDEMTATLEELKNFILPGGHPIVSYCHMVRCVSRRAERSVVSLSLLEAVDPIIIKYLNRLSDYFFVLARKLSSEFGVKEILWQS